MRKTIYAFAAMFLLTAAIFTSCDKDPVEDPKKNPPTTNECFGMYEVSTHYEDISGISFINANEGWACVSDDVLGANTSIMHTTDGGKTWAVIAENIATENAWLKSFYFINETTGFLLSSRFALLGTTDKGVTWKTIYQRWDSSMESAPNGIASNSTQTICYLGTTVGKDSIAYISNTTLEVTKTIPKPAQMNIGSAYHFSESGAITFGPVKRPNHNVAEMAYMDASGSMHYTDLSASEAYFHPSTAINFPSENVGYFVGDASQTSKNIVYKTTDGGKSWSEIYRLENHGQKFTFIDFADENNGIAGSGSALGATYKTTDGGHTWERVDCISDKFISPWNIAYPDVNHLYIATPIHPFERGIRFFSYPK